ncbi:MAG: 16S rRNA (uracil(1498)-N(3))-methyltransferase [Bacilli bacterium]|nr:16S rRNA (uracil(1498)-N(3))-methyltransferase [Bacilli bacterium]
MQHYFGTIADQKAIIDGKQVHHLIDVRRTVVGEQVEVSDGTESYLCVVDSLEPLSLSVIRKIDTKRELDIDLVLCFALLKGDHNDLIVLKGTELGVASFYPFLSSRCIVKPEKNEDQRISRLRKKAEEGAKQCRRDVVPSVSGYKTFQEALNLRGDVKIIAYEGEAGVGESLLSFAKGLKKRQRVVVLIGPEGGFTEEEAALAREKGFHFVSLGRRILRAETAAMYCASILGAQSEEEEINEPL